MKIITLIIICFLIGFLIVSKIIIYRLIPFVEQYALTYELDLGKRYGSGSWVLITGPSSGMGERFAHEFAARGFNLLLIGSKKTKKVIKDIKKEHNDIKIKFVRVDFSESFRDNFFDKIEKEIEKIGDKWSILINNVGYRTGCVDYSEMPLDEMKKTISVGTLVQSKLVQIAIKKFSKLNHHTSIVNITAQNSICTDLFAIDNNLTVPYLACYEATNAWGYFHAKSVYAEIIDKYPLIDFLIIMPGAVITKNTKPILENTIFSVDVEIYVKNIIKLMGNYNGEYCAHYGHSLSSALMNIFPFFDKKFIVNKVGKDFAESFGH